VRGLTQFGVFRYHGVLLLFCLLDLLAFAWLTPYDTLAPQLLENPDFSQGLQGWKLEGEAGSLHVGDGTLTIYHGTASDSTSLLQCHPAALLPERLLLSARGSSRGVVRGEKSWHEARVDLVGYDTQGEGNYRVSTRLLGMDGDQPWREARRVYENSGDYQRICVEISLYGASGQFQVQALSLYRAQPNTTYRTVSLLLLTGWGLLGLWLGKALFSYYRHQPQGRYLLIVFTLLLVGILMPQMLRTSLEVQILSMLSHLGITLTPTDTLHHGSVFDLWPQRWDLSKLSHLFGFTLLSGLIFSERRAAFVERFFGLLLLAVATELLQFYVPDRTPRLSDVVVDSLGILLGWGIASLFLRVRHQRSD
jgi:hypothetical protein